MILEKHLTIREILQEIKRLKNKIYSLQTILQKRINPLKGITYKDIISKGGGVSDVMTINLIKIEENKETIESLIESYYSYRDLAIDTIIEMQEEKTDAEMIVFYRDELHWKWKDVAKMVNYSVRQCQRKYDDEKNPKEWRKS